MSGDDNQRRNPRRSTDDLLYQMAADMATTAEAVRGLKEKLEPIIGKVDQHDGQINRARGYIVGASALGGASMLGHLLKWIGVAH